MGITIHRIRDFKPFLVPSYILRITPIDLKRGDLILKTSMEEVPIIQFSVLRIQANKQESANFSNIKQLPIFNISRQHMIYKDINLNWKNVHVRFYAICAYTHIERVRVCDLEIERVLDNLSDGATKEDNGSIVDAFKGVVSRQFEMILQSSKRRARHYRDNSRFLQNLRAL